MPLEVIRQHDLFDQSPIFEIGLPAKLEKSKWIEVLEAKGYLPDDIWYQDSHVKNEADKAKFGDVITHILNTAKQVCDNELLYVILDSYNELSLKEGEWM